MPKYIVKLNDGERDYYLEYSTVVESFTTWGMTLDEFKSYYQDEYGKSSLYHLEKRLERVELKGTSALMYDSVSEQLHSNMAGVSGTSLSIKQILQYYCKRLGEKPIGTNPFVVQSTESDLYGDTE